ncbi:MAG TPA: hypothetical protein PLQ93_05660 [Bacteroidia bacterium]|nr:hypothetical protein [Bacteroidia bacterium]
MRKEEEEFRKKLQDLLSQKEFGFEEKDWAEASRVIDGNRKSNRRRLVFFILSVLFVVGGAAWLGLNRNETETSSRTKGSKSEVARLDQRAELPIISEHKEIQRAPVISALNLPRPKNKVIQKDVLPEKINSPAGALNQTEPSGREEQVFNNSQIPGESPVKTEQGTLNGSVPPVVAENHNIPNEITPDLTAMVPLAAEGAVPVAVVNDPSAPSKATTVQEIAPQAVSAQADTPVADAANHNKAARDSVTNSTELNLPISPADNKAMVLSVEAGCIYLAGWEGRNGKEARGINPVFGLNYHYNVLNTYFLQIGLHFNSIAPLNAYSDTSRVIRYRFGEESDVRVISPRAAYYLDIPIYFSRKFGKHQYAGIGLHYARLMNVNSKVERYQEGLSSSGHQFSHELGYTDGFSSSNLQFGLYYRRELFHNLYLQPALVLGLRDIQDNSFFGAGGRQSASGLQLTLLYSLMNK